MKNKPDRIYLIIFLILEFIIMFIFKYFKIENTSIFIITQVVFLILFGIIYYVINLFIEKILERNFCIEYNKIMREYQKTNDEKVFYNKLKNIKKKPITEDLKNTYYLSMATAEYKNNKYEEALRSLDKIQTDDKHILKVIEDERKTILEDKNNNG